MTDKLSDEFKAQYPSYGYGPSYSPSKPDYSRCAGAVSSGFHSYQCKRKNGHGPHGAWCKMHDPVAAEAKREARYNAYKETRDRQASIAALKNEQTEIIRAIAEGHNDPRGLCSEWLERWDAIQATDEYTRH